MITSTREQRSTVVVFSGGRQVYGGKYPVTMCTGEERKRRRKMEHGPAAAAAAAASSAMS